MSGSAGKSNALPWILDNPGSEEVKDDVKVEYDMNMRNYSASKDVPIKAIEELRQKPEFGQSTLKLVFDLKGTGLTYKTAANFAIYPVNKTELVEEFAQMHNLDLNRTFRFAKNPDYSGRAAKMPFPTPSKISYREALTHFIDLTGALTKKTLKELIPLCEAEKDREL